MNQSVSQNRRWVLASRPHGAPVADNFRLEEQPVPVPAQEKFCCVRSGFRLTRTCAAA
ncbi:NADP-dependent oxidoreductase yncB [Enterobacter cloacae]|uniref:NADP-dependent oxidoreductase yncB n=1 Tax=Enterobacter cloacae TaxID=550 RepID=A0A377M1A2_ENTCL|nr:NADP-dependent oxidoreductase yncB [Enterobacter cloacae]